MNYLKSVSALIIMLLFWAGSVQTFAQKTASKDDKAKIKEKLDKIKDLKDKGKPDDDPDIIILANEAIELADSFYQIPPGNLDGKPTYDPKYKGDGKCSKSGKKVKVKIGTGALTTPGWLASSKYHEIVGHGSQAADGRWPDVLTGKIIEILETDAYDNELGKSDVFELDSAEKAENKRRRDEEHYNKLDSANRAKIDSLKKAGLPYQTAMISPTGRSKIVYSGKSQLFVAGTVLSEERMQVTVRGTKTIEGMVVTAEANGKKTEAQTNANGNAILDFSAIAGGLSGASTAVIKLLDSKGNVIQQTNTNILPGQSQIFDRPVIEQLPANLPTGDAVTIPGRNLGADAQLVIGEQFQETLSASDKEMTTFTDCKTGTQPAFVVTPNGVSESQTVNVYSLDFTIAKNSIKPKENVQAQVHYESIPVGTKLIFTNKSPGTITMTIPGAQNAANECIYTVPDKNGSIPVNITGILRGSFQIALDPVFSNSNQKPK